MEAVVVPKINVYLPDELAAAVKDAQVPVSAICQVALEHAVREVTALREDSPAGRRDDTWPLGLPPATSRYTNRARQVLLLGQDAAVALGHSYLGTEHLLLGILDEGANLAIKILVSLDLAPDDLRAELQAYLRPGESSERQVPLTPNTKTALELALTESAKLGHNYIGCEHLLLGLIAEPEGLAGRILRQLGLELRVTRRAVSTALSGYLHARDNEPRVGANRLDEILRRLDAIEKRLPN